MYFELDWKVNTVALGLNLAMIGYEPDLGVPWLSGARLARALPEPIRCRLDPKHGTDLPDVFLTGIPLFSERLIGAIKTGGADNFDSYLVEISGSAGGTVLKNYKAVNIIGKIEAADLTKSSFDPRSERFLVEFHRLVVDAKKVRGANLFRLAENPLKIVISERVKTALDAVPLVGVQLKPLDGREDEAEEA